VSVPEELSREELIVVVRDQAGQISRQAGQQVHRSSGATMAGSIPA